MAMIMHGHVLRDAAQPASVPRGHATRVPPTRWPGPAAGAHKGSDGLLDVGARGKAGADTRAGRAAARDTAAGGLQQPDSTPAG